MRWKKFLKETKYPIKIVNEWTNKNWKKKHHVKQLNGYAETQFTKEFTMNTIKYKCIHLFSFFHLIAF